MPLLKSSWLLNIPTFTYPPCIALEHAPNLSAGLRRKVNWSGTGPVLKDFDSLPEALNGMHGAKLCCT